MGLVENRSTSMSAMEETDTFTGLCTSMGLVEYRSTSMSAVEKTDTFTFEMLILPVKSIIGLNESDDP